LIVLKYDKILNIHLIRFYFRRNIFPDIKIKVYYFVYLNLSSMKFRRYRNDCLIL